MSHNDKQSEQCLEKNSDQEKAFDSSEYLMAIDVRKAYAMNTADLERLVWDCEGTFNNPDLGLLGLVKDDQPFMPKYSFQIRVLNQMYPGPGMYSPKTYSRIMGSAEDMTGMNYSNKPSKKESYCAYALDTCLVKKEAAILWAKEHCIPFKDPAKGISEIDIKRAEGEALLKDEGTIAVPRALWYGKNLESAYSALKETGYAPEIIARALMENELGSKTAIGRLFYDADNQDKEDKTYRDKVDSLLKAAGKYKITY